MAQWQKENGLTFPPEMGKKSEGEGPDQIQHIFIAKETRVHLGLYNETLD